MTGEGTPQIHPTQRLIAPDGTEVDIDEKIVPLVRAVWALGLNTAASCQDFGDGTAGQRAATAHESRYGGDAFIAYHAGYAWLKMPLPDAYRFLNMLLSTEFRDRVALRWTPGSWRIHVPVVFDEDHGGMALAYAVQIFFPRDQVASLQSVLNRLHGLREEGAVT